MAVLENFKLQERVDVTCVLLSPREFNELKGGMGKREEWNQTASIGGFNQGCEEQSLICATQIRIKKQEFLPEEGQWDILDCRSAQGNKSRKTTAVRARDEGIRKRDHFHK